MDDNSYYCEMLVNIRFFADIAFIKKLKVKYWKVIFKKTFLITGEFLQDNN